MPEQKYLFSGKLTSDKQKIITLKTICIKYLRDIWTVIEIFCDAFVYPGKEALQV